MPDSASFKRPLADQYVKLTVVTSTYHGKSGKKNLFKCAELYKHPFYLISCRNNIFLWNSTIDFVADKLKQN